MLLRKYVEGVPTEIFKATAIPVRLELWSAPVEVTTPRPKIAYLGTEPEHTNASEGVPIPYLVKINIDLAAHQTLYAWSYEAVLVCASVLEEK